MFGVDDALLAAGITAAGSVVAGGASAAATSKLNNKTMEFNRVEAEKQRQWSEAMAAQQNAWNLENWAKVNEYNSPAAQVERLREAGLNPLYYGLDGSSASGLDAAQPLGYERAQASNLQNPVSAGMDAAVKVATLSNIQADTAKKGQETQTEVAHREKILADLENTRQELLNLKAQEGLTKAQIDKIDKDLAWVDRLNEATLAEKEANAALNNAQKKRIEELLDGEKLIQSKTIEDFDYKWNKIKAELTKMAKETGLLQKDIENYALNHASNGFMGTGLSFQNLLRGLKEPKNREINAYGEGEDPLDLARSGQ